MILLIAIELFFIGFTVGYLIKIEQNTRK